MIKKKTSWYFWIKKLFFFVSLSFFKMRSQKKKNSNIMRSLQGRHTMLKCRNIDKIKMTSNEFQYLWPVASERAISRTLPRGLTSFISILAYFTKGVPSIYYICRYSASPLVFVLLWSYSLQQTIAFSVLYNFFFKADSLM